MNHLHTENKNIKHYYQESSESEYDESSESEYEEKGELRCKNIDPSLAKLMGIIVEEQSKSDWKPPTKSGLDNSKEIISSTYLKNKNIMDDIDLFGIIKDDILNYKTLSIEQLEYIKNLNNEDKFELIQTYNKILDVTIVKLKK